MECESVLEEGAGGLYRVHRLLFDLRWDDALAARFASEPEPVVDDYGLRGVQARAMRDRDVATLAAAGANPYLLYFGAIRMGLTRDEYYAALQGPTSSRSR